MENVSNTLLHFWQKQQFQNGLNPMRQLDSMRTFMGHIAFATHINNISEVEGSICLRNIFQEYISLLDSPEGLNNYADNALKLAQSCRNESKQWKSSLPKKITLEMLKDLGVTEELSFLTNNKEESSDFFKALKCPTSEEINVHHDPLTSDKVCLTTTNTPDYENLNSSGCFKSHEVQTSRRTEIEENSSNISSKKYLNKNNQNDRSGGISNVENAESFSKETSFCTAKEQLVAEMKQKNGDGNNAKSLMYGCSKKSLGTRRGLNSKFVPPVLGKNQDSDNNASSSKRMVTKNNEQTNESLKHIEPRMVELILSEIMEQGEPVSWDDIAGLEFAKNTIKEIIIWPMLRPDIFRGLRGPPKGILLFGPPGTGKTLIGKCIASQSNATFFSISASSLTSKWVGEGEKMVRALFTVARTYQPAVIFIDEIDSLLTHRSDSEHESSRRIKTEFLVQLDGATTSRDERLLVVGATNRPQELDEAARRRLVKRLYIPLPNTDARHSIICNLLQDQHNLTQGELQDICDKTEGYSGSDMKQLCQEAALGPIRSISFADIQRISANDVRPISYEDFLQAVNKVKASVSQDELIGYTQWNEKYGCQY